MQAKWIKLDLDGVIAIMTNLLTEQWCKTIDPKLWANGFVVRQLYTSFK